MIHENCHTKHSVFTAPDTYITQLYIMSIQPVNKAAEHLINSTPVLEKKQKKKKRKKAVNPYLIKNSKGGRGGGHYHKQWEGLGGVLCHSPSYVTTSRCARSLRLKELSD